MKPVTVVHLADLHFGRDVDLAQIDALEAYVPTLQADAIALAGDLSQRARHGELQRAAAFAKVLSRTAPVLALPGNHDVQWWASPFGLQGSGPLYRKYRRYFGKDLTPTLEVPGAVIASLLTSFGVASGSLSSNLNDLAVKGHLPESEIQRVRGVFQAAPPDAARFLVMHHNVLRGEISNRMGLARWKDAQQRLLRVGVDVILCGHDHQEGAALLGNKVPVSTAGTHTSRTRGRRAAAFNVVTVDEAGVAVRHVRWEGSRFSPATTTRFARPRTRS